ncbi:MAG: DUF6364 family protein [Azospirillaceae bacterium]|nr:DUF6364 family protein [Azospirillaceae bacterium]
MKTQVALRLEDSIVESAKREAERQNRSLANFVESALAEILIAGSSNMPVLSILDSDDFDGAVAVDDQGNIDEVETARFQHLLDVARNERD